VAVEMFRNAPSLSGNRCAETDEIADRASPAWLSGSGGLLDTSVVIDLDEMLRASEGVAVSADDG
jgi:hypothetical protein